MPCQLHIVQRSCHACRPRLYPRPVNAMGLDSQRTLCGSCSCCCTNLNVLGGGFARILITTRSFSSCISAPRRQPAGLHSFVIALSCWAKEFWIPTRRGPLLQTRRSLTPDSRDAAGCCTNDGRRRVCCRRRSQQSQDGLADRLSALQRRHLLAARATGTRCSLPAALPEEHMIARA